MKSDFEGLQKIPGQLHCGGPRGLGKFYGTDWPRRFCELALSNGASIDLVEVLDNFDTDFKKLADIDCSSSEIISRLVLGAAVIGSHLPCEVTDQLKIEVQRLNASEAGKASGAKSREIAQAYLDEWVPIVSPILKSTRETHPEFTQDDLAQEAIALWKDGYIKAPPTRKLIALISKMERAGELQKRKRKRPT
jgi:hypothetical protein